MWRPKDWKKGNDYYSYEEAFIAYESGANAILEALKIKADNLGFPHTFKALIKEDSNVQL